MYVAEKFSALFKTSGKITNITIHFGIIFGRADNFSLHSPTNVIKRNNFNNAYDEKQIIDLCA